jgi:hypothetical protein
MTQVSVRCSNARGGLLDGRVVDIEDLIDASDCATRVAGSLIAIPKSRDWREYCLSVTCFALPPASAVSLSAHLCV